MEEEVELEIRCDNEPVATTFGTVEQALAEARQYAYVYSHDGKTSIYMVHKTYSFVE